jgi:hypothetical protein
VTVRLTLTARQHAELQRHLFPGDGKEAVAVCLCGRAKYGDRTRLVVHRVHAVPYADCDRHVDRITWRTDSIVPVLQEADRRAMSILKIHSHPTDYRQFSAPDDFADLNLFPSIFGWIRHGGPHASAVMLPNGRIFARTVSGEGRFAPISLVTLIGDDLSVWPPFDEVGAEAIPEHALRNIQAFGEGTYRLLRRLRVFVAGASGTGSPVIEQLVRLHVGEIVLIDPDVVEDKNLNRILNTTIKHAQAKVKKVTRLAEAARDVGLGTVVVPIPRELEHPESIHAASSCDLAIGCLDSVDGRALLNRLTTFYSIPYVDIGVSLDADGAGGVEQISGAIHYFQPGRSSFFTRNVFTRDDVAAAALKRTDPKEYERRRKQKYIRGVQVDRPAVISVNMFFAALGVNEVLARLHGFRYPNSEHAVTRISLSSSLYQTEPEAPDCASLSRHVGRGDVAPLLDLPDLDEELFKDDVLA